MVEFVNYAYIKTANSHMVMDYGLGYWYRRKALSWLREQGIEYQFSTRQYELAAFTQVVDTFILNDVDAVYLKLKYPLMETLEEFKSAGFKYSNNG